MKTKKYKQSTNLNLNMHVNKVSKSVTLTIVKQGTVFSEKTDAPHPSPTSLPTHTTMNFQLSIAVTLKIRQRSAKSTQFFVMFQLYIYENVLKIQPPVHKILCRKESDADANANGIRTKNNMSPSPEVVGGIITAGRFVSGFYSANVSINPCHAE